MPANPDRAETVARKLGENCMDCLRKVDAIAALIREEYDPHIHDLQQNLIEMIADRDRLAAELERLDSEYKKAMDRVSGECADLEMKLDKAKAALQEHGEHQPRCVRRTDAELGKPSCGWRVCDCGLDAALAELRGGEEGKS